MHAMVLEEGSKELTPKNLPKPLPKEHELLVKVHACGVCRTDLHIIDGELTSPRFPLIPGHQIVGTVEITGKNTSLFTSGERVGIPWLGGCCGHCFFCSRKEENLCDQPVFTGFHRNGGYAEYCLVNENFCYRIPSQYSDTEAAPLLCAGLIGFRALRLCGDAQKIGLLGFGASAHIISQVISQQGREAYAFTRKGDLSRQDFALSLGACWAGSIDAPPPLLDAVIIFASDGNLIPHSLKLVRKGGIVVCAGIHMSDIPSFSYVDLWNERMIRSVANLTRADVIDFLAHADKHPIKTHTTLYPLEKANQALKDLREGRLHGSAVLKII